MRNFILFRFRWLEIVYIISVGNFVINEMKRDNKPSRRDKSLKKAKFSSVIEKTPEKSIKLSKQQKRDLKRNAKLQQSNIPRASSINISYKNNPTIPLISAYKRETIYPTRHTINIPKINSFFTPKDKLVYNNLLQTAYQGFNVLDNSQFELNFHSSFSSCFKELDKMNIFQHDITQPAGLNTKLAKTLVSRCLVGDAGITYKYLGIRMFSIPWNPGGTNHNIHTICLICIILKYYNNLYLSFF